MREMSERCEGDEWAIRERYEWEIRVREVKEMSEI